MVTDFHKLIFEDIFFCRSIHIYTLHHKTYISLFFSILFLTYFLYSDSHLKSHYQNEKYKKRYTFVYDNSKQYKCSQNGDTDGAVRNGACLEPRVIAKAPEGQGCPRCGGFVYMAEQMLARGRVSISFGYLTNRN